MHVVATYRILFAIAIQQIVVRERDYFMMTMRRDARYSPAVKQ